jgi:hypothetical protein
MKGNLKEENLKVKFMFIIIAHTYGSKLAEPCNDFDRWTAH